MKMIPTTGRQAAEARKLLAALENRGAARLDEVMPVVHRIVRDVRRRGDAALRKYAMKFDRLTPQSQLQISPAEMRNAWDKTPRHLQEALGTAAANIRAFATRQMPLEWSFSPVEGLTTGQRIRPLLAAGCYVPGGRYPLPSTLLMTVIPAQVAGVRRIVVVSPKPARETLAAAHLLGVEEFYRVGGAQAIAALAYGTATVPRVDRIVGPGNLYVTAAKKLVAFDCGIDMLAGPTEVVIASDRGRPSSIASDIVAQAEHDPEALGIFVTATATLAESVLAEIEQRVKANAVARESLSRNGYIFIAANREEAREITNRLAPEHLTVDDESDLEWVTAAGSVFVGNYSAQPLGDYISGPNHTLPTGGTARLRGGLSVLDFVKIITVQQYTQAGITALAPAAMALAEAEGLAGHAEAIRCRQTEAETGGKTGAEAGVEKDARVHA